MGGRRRTRCLGLLSAGLRRAGCPTAGSRYRARRWARSAPARPWSCCPGYQRGHAVASVHRIDGRPGGPLPGREGSISAWVRRSVSLRPGGRAGASAPLPRRIRPARRPGSVIGGVAGGAHDLSIPLTVGAWVSGRRKRPDSSVGRKNAVSSTPRPQGTGSGTLAWGRGYPQHPCPAGGARWRGHHHRAGAAGRWAAPALLLPPVAHRRGPCTCSGGGQPPLPSSTYTGLREEPWLPSTQPALTTGEVITVYYRAGPPERWILAVPYHHTWALLGAGALRHGPRSPVGLSRRRPGYSGAWRVRPRSRCRTGDHRSHGPAGFGGGPGSRRRRGTCRPVRG